MISLKRAFAALRQPEAPKPLVPEKERLILARHYGELMDALYPDFKKLHSLNLARLNQIIAAIEHTMLEATDRGLVDMTFRSSDILRSLSREIYPYPFLERAQSILNQAFEEISRSRDIMPDRPDRCRHIRYGSQPV